IAGVLQTVVHRLELGQRVGEPEVYELTLARFANERLAGERRGADERAKARFRRHPQLDQIGRQIFRSARRVQTPQRGARGVECTARAPLCGRAHFTIRSSPATALPRMKLSASWVGMRTPVCRKPCCDTPFMNSCIECAGCPVLSRMLRTISSQDPSNSIPSDATI